MPIREENKHRYPCDWKQISNRIRFVRAMARCECRGECGSRHHQTDERCTAVHMNPHPATGSNVVLTVAHLNHEPEDCGDDNLKAMCQACHLAYDAEHHAETRSASKDGDA